ncbi:MAG TPA: hypothetical protein VEN78_04710 [Bradyrhizobium sp.]|nr:hypothetical protein [Bradyrhizobium sp.]
MHGLNNGNRCLRCGQPGETNEDDNRGKQAFHSKDLNKSIFLAQADLTIADGGVADNPSIGMNEPESPPRKPENLLMVMIDESVLRITLSSNVP